MLERLNSGAVIRQQKGFIPASDKYIEYPLNYLI